MAIKKQAESQGLSTEHIPAFQGRARGGKTHWMQHAVKHPGALTRSADKAGMSPHAFAEKHKHDSGTTGKRARLALVFSRFRPH